MLKSLTDKLEVGSEKDIVLRRFDTSSALATEFAEVQWTKSYEKSTDA